MTTGICSDPQNITIIEPQDKLAQVEGDASLDSLAQQIRQGHEQLLTSMSNSLLEARKLGQLLAVAKEKCKHGQWLPWLQDNCGLATRTAQAYMRIDREWSQLTQNAQGLAYLKVEDALSSLAKHKKQSSAKAESAEDDTQATLAQPANTTPEAPAESHNDNQKAASPADSSVNDESSNKATLKARRPLAEKKELYRLRDDYTIESIIADWETDDQYGCDDHAFSKASANVFPKLVTAIQERFHRLTRRLEEFQKKKLTIRQHLPNGVSKTVEYPVPSQYRLVTKKGPRRK